MVLLKSLNLKKADQMHLKYSPTFFFLLPVIVIMFSCNSKKYIYLHEEKNVSSDSNFYSSAYPGYKLQSGDYLDIRFHSTMTDVEEMFRFSGGENTSASSMNNLKTDGQSAFFYGYAINDSGYIRIPVIGSLHLNGLDIHEAQDLIEKEAQKYVNDVMVKVRLYGTKITLLGEFNNAGTHYIYKDHVHILDAVAAAGDFTYNGDRKHLRIMRQTNDGIYTYRVNLTDKQLLTNNRFYLMPNDIVYAEPLPRKIFKESMSGYLLALTTVSSTLALILILTGK